MWRTLARAYLATGRIDDALDLFVRALGIAPDDEELRAEYWSELGRHQRYAEISKDAGKIGEMGKRDWKLRWNEAEAYAGLGKKMEARACFSALNFDDRLHVDIRKRAKRAIKSIDEAPPETGAAPRRRRSARRGVSGSARFGTSPCQHRPHPPGPPLPRPGGREPPPSWKRMGPTRSGERGEGTRKRLLSSSLSLLPPLPRAGGTMR